MSSDADYASFLDKANQDPKGPSSQSQSKSTSKSYSTKAVNTDVPYAIKAVDGEFYTSDADEPFEPVSLKWDGKGALGADEFKKLLGHGGEVEEYSVKDFDPRDQYGTVVDAVKKAADGEVKVFRVAHGGTRAEYFVVGVDGKEGKVVGLKAKAVES